MFGKENAAVDLVQTDKGWETSPVKPPPAQNSWDSPLTKPKRSLEPCALQTAAESPTATQPQDNLSSFSFQTLDSKENPDEVPRTPPPLSKPRATSSGSKQKTSAASATKNEQPGTYKVPLGNSTNVYPRQMPPSSPQHAYLCPPQPGYLPGVQFPPIPAPGNFARSPGVAAYNNYQLPSQPMYPPYTPHPAHCDPSGHFGPPAGLHPAVLPYSSQSSWSATGPMTPNSSGARTCTTPSTGGTGYPRSNRSQDSFWPSRSSGRSPADQTSTWRRSEHTGSPRGTGTPKLSLRQMTSICFQASSKGTQAKLPKAAVKELVKHQLETHEPVHAPWYRRYHGEKSPMKAASDRDEVEKQNTPVESEPISPGTGVWIPKIPTP